MVKCIVEWVDVNERDQRRKCVEGVRERVRRGVSEMVKIDGRKVGGTERRGQGRRIRKELLGLGAKGKVERRCEA